MKTMARIVLVLALFLLLFRYPVEAEAEIEFIDTSFENASPLWWEVDDEGVINVHLLYDHERSSINRAAGHFHFQIQGEVGEKVTIEFKNLENYWNGRPASIARELKAAVISQDGQNWTSVPLDELEESRIRLSVQMPGPKLFVARVEPYRLSDLQQLLESIRGNPLVEIRSIGKTVEGRDLEIVRLGNVDAPKRVFVRARAHPWESGGNWVVEGLVARLLMEDAAAKDFLERYCLWIMPMANKDGVARGRTRFNLQGMDLNRNWNKPPNRELAPENHALEEWLRAKIEEGKKPHLAIELHNDGNGRLHISRPPVPNLDEHLRKMARLEELLRQHTWFREGSTGGAFRNSGTLGDGWLERFGIDAVVHEFNCNWIVGLQDYPSAKHWKQYGADLAQVLYEYFEQPDGAP